MNKIFRIISTLIIIYLTNHSFAFSQNEKIKIGLLAPLSGEYKELGQSIIKSTRMALNDIGTEYRGFLYTGLMIINNEPYLIEYNVRMGDPECQTILPLLKSDLGEIILSCCNQNLGSQKIEWLNKKSLCVVLCSNGYPGIFKKKVIIKNKKYMIRLSNAVSTIAIRHLVKILYNFKNLTF